MSRLPPCPGWSASCARYVDMAMLRRIADASRQGRSLLVNTSDVDNGGNWVWDVGSEAQRAVENGRHRSRASDSAGLVRDSWRVSIPRD